MKTQLRLSLLILFALWGFRADLQAQIHFKNNSKEPVYVAFARYVTVAGGGFWQTRGWWTVGAGTTHLAFESIKPGDSIGYWCMTTLTTKVYEGTRRLLVHPDEKFTVNDAANQTVAETRPDLDWYKFRIISLPEGATQGTIPFRE